MMRLLALALASMVASFGFHTTASAATTLFVDDNNCPGPGTGSKADPFCTITAAVAAAANGDTIKVRAGTYEEEVVVNKTLQILGAQAGETALKGRTKTSRESVIGDPAGSDGPISLAANGITVDGFTLRDAWTGAGTGANVWTDPTFSGYRIRNNIIRGGSIGISLNASGASPSSVVRNRIANNNDCFPGPCSALGTGIYSDINLDNVSINKNAFINNSSAAINIVGADNDGVTIARNSADSAIHLSNTQATILKNRLSNSNTHAIQLLDNNDGTLIKRNAIKNPEWSGIRFTTGNATVTVSKNEILGVGIEGIHLGSSTTGSTFVSNLVSGSTGRGVLVEVGSTGNTFTENTVKHSAGAFDIEDDTVGGTGTDGTDNTYSGNICGRSDPASICD